MTEKTVSETEHVSREADRADRSLFMQELLLALMSESTDAIRTGIADEQEFCSSFEDLMFEVDGLLSKSASSPATSSQHGSTSSLAAVCDDTDSTLVANSQPVANCEPVGKESFSVVDVSSCGAAGGLEVACTKGRMS